MSQRHARPALIGVEPTPILLDFANFARRLKMTRATLPSRQATT